MRALASMLDAMSEIQFHTAAVTVAAPGRPAVSPGDLFGAMGILIIALITFMVVIGLLIASLIRAEFDWRAARRAVDIPQPACALSRNRCGQHRTHPARAMEVTPINPGGRMSNKAGFLDLFRIRAEVVEYGERKYFDEVLRIRRYAYTKYNIEDRLCDDSYIDRRSVIFLMSHDGVPYATGRCTPANEDGISTRKHVNVGAQYLRGDIFELGRFSKVDCEIARHKWVLFFMIMICLRVMISRYGAIGFVAYARDALVRRYRLYRIGFISDYFFINGHRYIAFYCSVKWLTRLHNVLVKVSVVKRQQLSNGESHE